MCSSIIHLSSSLMDPLQSAHTSLALESSAQDPEHQAWPQQLQAEGKNDLPQTAGNISPDKPRMPLAFFAMKAHCWLMFNLVSTRKFRSSSTKLLSTAGQPQCLLEPGVIPPQVQELAFHFAELHEVPLRLVFCLSMFSCLPSVASNFNPKSTLKLLGNISRVLEAE